MEENQELQWMSHADYRAGNLLNEGGISRVTVHPLTPDETYYVPSDDIMSFELSDGRQIFVTRDTYEAMQEFRRIRELDLSNDRTQALVSLYNSVTQEIRGLMNQELGMPAEFLAPNVPDRNYTVGIDPIRSDSTSGSYTYTVSATSSGSIGTIVDNFEAERQLAENPLTTRERQIRLSLQTGCDIECYVCGIDFNMSKFNGICPDCSHDNRIVL